jgi:hypothetical protein
MGEGQAIVRVAPKPDRRRRTSSPWIVASITKLPELMRDTLEPTGGLLRPGPASIVLHWSGFNVGGASTGGSPAGTAVKSWRTRRKASSDVLMNSAWSATSVSSSLRAA